MPDVVVRLLRASTRRRQHGEIGVLRVLHVSEVHWGGVVTLIQHFVEGQRRAGDDVFLLAPPAFPGVPTDIKVPWSLVRKEPRTFPLAYRELVRAVRRLEPDVIHLHSFLAGLIGRLPHAIEGVPVVYQPHAWSFDLREDRLFGASVKSWEKLASGRTAVLVTNCEDEIAEGREVGIRTKAHSIGVIVDTHHHRPVDDVARQLHRANCGVTERRMLVCIGRLARQKGQDLLVRAWERARPPETELVLVGPGDPTQLAGLAPTQWGRTIRAVGEQTDIRPWLHASEALLLSSRYETVSLVIAEAMSCGRPVVTTAVNGASEVVLGGDLPAAGIVVPLEDMRGLLDSAERLLGDELLSARFSDAGRQRAERLFSSEQVSLRLRAAYESARVPRQRAPHTPAHASR